MDYIDYYKTLGIPKTATADEIKKAYRKLARQYHPDTNKDPGAHKKFQEINEANEVLSDPENRKKYDKYGKDWQHGEEYEKARKAQQQAGGFGRQGFGGQSFEGADFGDDRFSDFFTSMFGGSGGGRQSQAKYRGQDLNATLQLSLRDAFRTHQQTLTINGKNVRITIPAGIEDGQVIKLKSYGAPGVNGGPAGDLYITFNITNDTPFKRTGSDLQLAFPLDLYTAVLGGDVTIDTLHGKVKLKIKPETQNNTRMRVKGKGFPVYKVEGHFGDLFITFTIQIPTGLTEKEKELFTELRQLRNPS
jgi:curved DNA-binding protein